MTTLRPDVDIASIFEAVQDPAALAVVQRVIQAEVVFHESRLAQLRELDRALGKQLEKSRG